MSYKLNIVAKDSLVNHFSAQDGSLEYSWKLMTKMLSCIVVSSMNIVFRFETSHVKYHYEIDFTCF
jgi:hypothetical protein